MTTIRIRAAALCALFLAVSLGKSYGITDAQVRDISSSELDPAMKQLNGILRKNPKDTKALFLEGVEVRSCFDVQNSSKVFAAVMSRDHNSPEGLASACILGVDLSKDAASALYYYNALLMLAEQHPGSIPLNWAPAILARSITKDTVRYKLSSELRCRILIAGIRYYQRVLDLMAPAGGPSLVHLTYGNLLEALEVHDMATAEREKALKLDRTPVILHALSDTYFRQGQDEQAIPLIKEAIEKEPQSGGYHREYALILERQGKFKEAIQAAALAFSLDPSWDEGLMRCMFMARDMGDLKSAYDFSRQQVEKFPQEHVSRVWNARFAAMNGVPDASRMIEEEGTLSYDNRWFPWSRIQETMSTNDPWESAVQHGDLAAVRSLISPENVSRKFGKEAQTALMIAAKDSYEQMASDLIKAGAAINETDANKDTALHYAAQFKNPRLTKLLLKAGADPNLKDKFGETPLIKCCYNDDWQGLGLLLSHKADPSVSHPHLGPPLLYAAGHGNIDGVNLLLSHGAAVDGRDETGATALMTSVKLYIHPFIIAPLLKAGADINARDKDGRTVLHYAISPQLNPPALDFLLDKGADPTMADNFGTTPITQARALGFEDVAKKLELKAGKAEPFVFPKLLDPQPGLSADEMRATYFVIPFLMAQGHPLGRLTGMTPNDKRAAREELKFMFGIDNAKKLRKELMAKEPFAPSLRENAGDLTQSQGIDTANLLKSLNAAVEKVHRYADPLATDESAWVNSRIIYLAKLGVTAGYLKKEEAAPMIAAASTELAKKYSCWKDFLDSFLVGAKFHNGCEYPRYKNIADLIASSAPPWSGSTP